MVACGHLCIMATCSIRPAVDYGHLWLPGQHGYLCNMVTRAVWSPVPYGHPCSMATCGHTRSMATCAIWSLAQYGHLRMMATCAIRPPVRYVQFGHLCNMCNSVTCGYLDSMTTRTVWPVAAPLGRGRRSSLRCAAASSAGHERLGSQLRR